MFSADIKMIVLLITALLLRIVTATPAHTRPNIIVIMADDLGWNDVSFHGSNQIPTPNIDALAYNGIILNSHYVPALCTPSRASLLTGKNPTQIGMQHLVILAPEPWGLPLEERVMPEYLREAGYSTHAIGKWHLGFYKKEYTPTHRGFDTHFGYWNGFHDYYDHSMKATFAPYKGYDMRRNMSVDLSAVGRYSTDLFTEEAVHIISEHNSGRGPLFMYLAHLAPHTGNEEEPFQAPDEEIAKFGHIEDPERRVYAAMVSKVDQSVGEIMAALRIKGMLDNSIIVFMSDNGAPTYGIHSNRGSNWPLRGMKNTAMEGGVRGVAAIWSPLLNNTQRVSDQLMHISDWLPTFYSAAGLDVRDLGNIDGVDMWGALSENKPSPRVEVLHNIDDISNYSSLRNGDWKYTSGTTQGGKADGWYGESGLDESKEIPSQSKYDISAVLRSQTGVAILGLVTKLQLKEKEARLTKIIDNESRQDSKKNNSPMKYRSHRRLLSKSVITLLRQQAQVVCLDNKTVTNTSDCSPTQAPCLFNLRDDPCETRNLADLHPLIVSRLEASLLRLRRTTVAPLNVPSDPNANPALWNGIWSSWQDDIKKKYPPVLELPTSPVTILTILASLFAVIIFILMAVILRLYLCRMPDSCSLFSIFLFKDNESEESGKSKSVE